VNWAERIDLETGRPVENTEITRAGTEPRLLAPGPAGAHNWHPMSFNHKTGLVYLPVTEHWVAYPFGGGRPEGGLTQEQNEARRKIATELMAEAERREHGWLAAWDPVAQREVWRVPHSRAGSGGVLSTAGNLVFQGNPDRKLTAYRATDGKLLWQFDTQNVPIAAPITYTMDGEQYVAATTGWGGGMALVEMSQGLPPLRNGAARLLVFKLGGKGQLTPFKLAGVATKPEPPLSRAPEASVEQGRMLFAETCATCHGTNARGGLKDLRWMTRETHTQFEQIVLGGLRADKGMPSFSGELTKDQVTRIRDYIIARANEDYFTE
jgi:quinohemoprotein ethanol dehydrogenase